MMVNLITYPFSTMITLQGLYRGVEQKEKLVIDFETDAPFCFGQSAVGLMPKDIRENCPKELLDKGK